MNRQPLHECCVDGYFFVMTPGGVKRVCNRCRVFRNRSLKETLEQIATWKQGVQRLKESA